MLNNEMLEGYYLMEQNASETSRKVIMHPLRRSSFPVLGYDACFSIVYLHPAGTHPLKIQFLLLENT